MPAMERRTEERTGCGQLNDLNLEDEEHFVGERILVGSGSQHGILDTFKDHKIKEEDREWQSKDGSVLVQQKR